MAANDQQPPNKRTIGFDCEFVEPPPSEYIQSECPVCLQIIREPYQVTCCGKKFCKACIEYIKDTKKACPTCKKKEFLSYPDKGHKQLLYSLKVRCSHQREGCEWMGELGQFDNHHKQLDGCQCVKIACINNCGNQMKRKDIENHQNHHCPNRPVSCEHCRVYKATYNDLTQTHWPVCGSFPLSCPNECGKTPLQRQNIDSHVANECPLTTINCDFHHVACTVKLPRQDMAEHLRDNLPTHVSLLAISHAKQQEKITTLETENRQLKAKNIQLELQVNTAPLIVNSRPLGPPIITMTNYQQHKRDKDDWFSPPFYTHPQGYKICFRVIANGQGIGKGTHVSVYVNFMKGEFDDTLKWPFRGSISYQLLDQANGTDHVAYTVIHDGTVENTGSGRVTEGKRELYGRGAWLIAQSALEPKYLHNDTLLFQVYKVEIT